MSKSISIYLYIAALFLLSACEEEKSAPIKQETIEITVSASGELESKKNATIGPPAVSRMWQYQIKQLVPESSQVKKGQVIVSFDDKKITERLIDKQTELNRAKKQLDNKKIKEVENKETLILSVAEKQMEFDKAKRRTEIVDNSRSKNDREKAKIDFVIAENDLFLAQAKLEFHQKNTLLNLKLAQSKVDRLTNKVNNIKHDISRLKVTAPIDGMVLYKENWNGEKPAVGENIQFGQPVLAIAVIEEMQLKAQIAEPDSGKVTLGQQVKIFIDSAKEQVFRGKIVSLGQVFRDKSPQDKRRIFDAIISFDETNTDIMRPGMTARVEIITNTIENALTLPITAITRKSDETTVMRIGSLGNEKVAIEVGAVIGSKAVISKGLSQGDVVAL